MNRMEKVICLVTKGLDEIAALSNDDWKVEDKQEYAKVEAKQMVVREEIAHSLFIFKTMCLQNAGMNAGDIIKAKEKVGKCR